METGSYAYFYCQLPGYFIHLPNKCFTMATITKNMALVDPMNMHLLKCTAGLRLKIIVNNNRSNSSNSGTHKKKWPLLLYDSQVIAIISLARLLYSQPIEFSLFFTCFNIASVHTNEFEGGKDLTLNSQPYIYTHKAKKPNTIDYLLVNGFY